jgi:hypothetical protein
MVVVSYELTIDHPWDPTFDCKSYGLLLTSPGSLPGAKAGDVITLVRSRKDSCVSRSTTNLDPTKGLQAVIAAMPAEPDGSRRLLISVETASSARLAAGWQCSTCGLVNELAPSPRLKEKESIRNAFFFFDKDKDGKLSCAEFREVLTQVRWLAGWMVLVVLLVVPTALERLAAPIFSPLLSPDRLVTMFVVFPSLLPSFPPSRCCDDYVTNGICSL